MRPTSFRQLLTLTLIFAAGVMLSSRSAAAQDTPPQDARTLTVVTFNVQNAFDVFDNPYTQDEGTAIKSRRAMSRIAASIARTDADVVALQEVENEFVLAQMIADFLPNAGYRYVAVAQSNDGRGITNGVISRLPIDRIASYRHRILRHPDDPEPKFRRLSRDIMHVTFLLDDGRKLELLNVHLKSNRTVDNSDPNAARQRTAEAIETRAVAESILADQPDALVLAVGDFNSDFERRPTETRDWPAMQAVLAPDKAGNRPLMDVHADLPRTKRITIPSKGQYPPAVFDFILASPALAAAVVPEAAYVLIDPELNKGSDHRPVVASFNLNQAPPQRPKR